MKVKLAVVGLAHFLMQSPQAHQMGETTSVVGEASEVAVQKQAKEKLPDAFEKKLIDSKKGSVIAAPSRESASGGGACGKA